MEAAGSKSRERLCREILSDAGRARDELLRNAQQNAEVILAEAEAEAEKLREERLAQARDEAERQKEMLLATVPVEVGGLRAARVETLLQSVHELARKLLLARDGFDYRETVIALTTDAIEHMAGDAFEARLSPEDRAAFGDALAAEITQRVWRSPVAITLVDDPAISEGGVIVQDSDGRQVYDNRFTARLERLWPELRRQIATQTSLVTTSAPPGGGT